MAKVTVYYFQGYQIATDEMIISKRMATLEAIKRFCCAPLMDTAKAVDTSEVDEDGRYPKKK
jgi:hypothetical protein